MSFTIQAAAVSKEIRWKKELLTLAPSIRMALPNSKRMGFKRNRILQATSIQTGE